MAALCFTQIMGNDSTGICSLSSSWSHTPGLYNNAILRFSCISVSIPNLFNNQFHSKFTCKQFWQNKISKKCPQLWQCWFPQCVIKINSFKVIINRAHQEKVFIGTVCDSKFLLNLIEIPMAPPYADNTTFLETGTTGLCHLRNRLVPVWPCHFELDLQ